MYFFPEIPETKCDDEKLAQSKSTKVNGEESITHNNDSNIATKELILNGSETSSDTIVNGDTKKDLVCDISCSAKVVSNGISYDSDDAKLSKADEQQTLVATNVSNKIEVKPASEKKKEKKKTRTTESDSEKKQDSPEPKKSTDDKKEAGDAGIISDSPDKVNGESKIVNGERDRESSPSEDGDDKKRDAEVVFIQDMGFTVKIVSPGAEPLDIQVYR